MEKNLKQTILQQYREDALAVIKDHKDNFEKLTHKLMATASKHIQEFRKQKSGISFALASLGEEGEKEVLDLYYQMVDIDRELLGLKVK